MLGFLLQVFRHLPDHGVVGETNGEPRVPPARSDMGAFTADQCASGHCHPVIPVPLPLEGEEPLPYPC